MPEGHTVHRLASELGELVGPPLRVSSPQGRFADGAARLDGACLAGLEAYGKHLLAPFSTGDTLHVHLGMAGKWFRYDGNPLPESMRQVRLRLAAETFAWDLVAPIRCELLDEPAVSDLVARLGPDPLRDDADEAAALTAMRRSSTPIGAALLDQSVVAGVGNVFRCEALHALGINPSRPSRSLSEPDAAALWATVKQMMTQAVQDGRIVTVDVPDRLAVPEAEARRVYKQQHCRDCDAEVVVSKVGGRTAYFCPVEQPS